MVTDTFASVFTYIIALHINKGSVIIRQFIAHTTIRDIHVITEKNNNNEVSIKQFVNVNCNKAHKICCDYNVVGA